MRIHINIILLTNLLFSSMIQSQCSQIQEGSILYLVLQETNSSATTGRALAEQHAWWQYHHSNGNIPEISPNQLGQDDIRYPNTPIPDTQYDTLYIPVSIAAKLFFPITLQDIILIQSPRQTTTTPWINIMLIPERLRYAPGSQQNPINIGN